MEVMGEEAVEALVIASEEAREALEKGKERMQEEQLFDKRVGL